MFEGERLSCWDCFVRSWFWIFEVLLLGIPFLAVFSNAKRRPLHDRVCDTLVVSRVAAGVKGPGEWERLVIRGFFAVAFAAVMLIAIFQLRGVIGRLKADQKVAELLERDSGACEVVNKKQHRTN